MHNDDLTDWRDQEMDLSTLVERAAILLGRLDVEARDGRVSAAPDARTIRYYQSAGLLDPPLRYMGRQAVYGFDHLTQLAVIKLLQAQGLSLAQVQRALAAADAAALETALVEALADRPILSSFSESKPAEARELRGRADPESSFVPLPMASLPSPLAPASPPSPLAPASSSKIPAGHPNPADSSPSPRALISAELAPGILVTIDPARVTAPKTIIQALARALRSEGGAPDRDLPEEKR